MMRGFLVVAAMIMLAGCSQSPQRNTTAETTNETELTDAGKFWVTTQYADRHSCPSEKCGIVGRLFFREAAIPVETKDGWVRITKLYDASCQNGESQYVDKGNAACTAANGITNGQLAEWVKESQLSASRPADPAATASADESIVADSDDFTQHRAAFVKVARDLIASGRCTAGDFKEQGGWVKSVNQRDEPVYFTYCGGMTATNKIYMNAETATEM